METQAFEAAIIPDDARMVPDDLVVERLAIDFDGKQVLHGIDLTFRAGAVHGLIGHNGSGKSTLVRILAGYYRASSGTVRLGSHQLPPGAPRSTHRAGLRFVHQELALVQEFTALENFGLGGEYSTRGPGAIDWKQQAVRLGKAFDRLGCTVPMHRPISELTAVERALVAIARAIGDVGDGGSIRFLVLDEPTTTLEPSERDHLFDVVRRLATSGVGVILISHQLRDVINMCTSISVLRDGSVVENLDAAHCDRERLVAAMLGPAAAEVNADLDGAGRIRSGARSEQPASLAVHGLRSPTLRDVDIELAPGECVGVVGLAGSGREEIAYALAGALPCTTEAVTVGGTPVSALSPARCRDLKIALVPGNRQAGSMVSSFSLRENLTFTSLDSVAGRFGHINRRKEAALAREWIERFDIKPGDAEYETRLLSGGNKQKVILAKWLRIQPQAMLIDEPTAGVDVGAVKTIMDTLREFVDDGGSLLVSTSELSDVLSLADRILVLSEGRIWTELVRGRDEFSERSLLLAMAGGAGSGAGDQ